MKNKVNEFIKRRFPIDSRYLDGNCYFFAVILQSRFGGIIFYDSTAGHFCTLIDDIFYDYQGEYQPIYPINWDILKQNDPLWAKRIVRDCID